MSNNLKNLVFDLGSILVNLDIKRCKKAFTKPGFQQIDTLIQTYLQTNVFSKLETGQISIELFCQSLRHDTGLNVNDEEIIDAWQQGLDIFRSVMNRTGISSHDTLLIDNSKADCKVARSLGWETYWVQTDNDWTQSLI